MKLHKTYRYLLHHDKTYYVRAINTFILIDDNRYSNTQANNENRTHDWVKVYPQDFEETFHEAT